MRKSSPEPSTFQVARETRSIPELFCSRLSCALRGVEICVEWTLLWGSDVFAGSDRCDMVQLYRTW